MRKEYSNLLVEDQAPKRYIGWNVLIGFISLGLLHGIYYIGCLFARAITKQWPEKDPISFFVRKYHEKYPSSSKKDQSKLESQEERTQKSRGQISEHSESEVNEDEEPSELSSSDSSISNSKSVNEDDGSEQKKSSPSHFSESGGLAVNKDKELLELSSSASSISNSKSVNEDDGSYQKKSTSRHFSEHSESAVDKDKEFLELSSSASSFFNSKSEIDDEGFRIFFMDAGDLGNTPLHRAIVRNQTPKAIALIDKISSDKVNITALGNTPLMLALKKGNLTVARALLSRPEIDVRVQDDSGLTALHWAAILRADDIIKSLLDKGAELYDEEDCNIEEEKHSYCGPHPEIKLSHSTAPRDLYMLNPLEHYFYDYFHEEHELMPLDRLDVRDPRRQRVVAQNGGRFPRFFAEGHSGLKKAIAYSDIVFHIADICHNMGWATNNMREKYAECQEAITSQIAFRRAFLFSYPTFLKERNQLDVNPDIIEMLSKDFDSSVELSK